MQRIANVTVQGNMLLITREKNHIALPSYLKFNAENKKEILKNYADIKFSFLSLTESSKQIEIEKIINQCAWQDTQFKSILANAKQKNILIMLIFYSKCLFESVNNKKNYHYYLDAFKKNLLDLQTELTEEKFLRFLQKCATAKDAEKMMQGIALAYHDIISNDQLLSHFRSSEFMGHDIAYKIALQKNIKQLAVIDTSENILEKYEVEEIICLQNGKRDDALIGSILIPTYSDCAIPDVIVIYINFAGTHNKDTLLADKEIAPGEESYRRSEDQILQQITTQVNKDMDDTKNQSNSFAQDIVWVVLYHNYVFILANEHCRNHLTMKQSKKILLTMKKHFRES